MTTTKQLNDLEALIKSVYTTTGNTQITGDLEVTGNLTVTGGLIVQGLSYAEPQDTKLSGVKLFTRQPNFIIPKCDLTFGNNPYTAFESLHDGQLCMCEFNILVTPYERDPKYAGIGLGGSSTANPEDPKVSDVRNYTGRHTLLIGSQLMVYRENAVKDEWNSTGWYTSAFQNGLAAPGAPGLSGRVATADARPNAIALNYSNTNMRPQWTQPIYPETVCNPNLLPDGSDTWLDNASDNFAITPPTAKDNIFKYYEDNDNGYAAPGSYGISNNTKCFRRYSVPEHFLEKALPGSLSNQKGSSEKAGGSGPSKSVEENWYQSAILDPYGIGVSRYLVNTDHNTTPSVAGAPRPVGWDASTSGYWFSGTDVNNKSDSTYESGKHDHMYTHHVRLMKTISQYNILPRWQPVSPPKFQVQTYIPQMPQMYGLERLAKEQSPSDPHADFTSFNDPRLDQGQTPQREFVSTIASAPAPAAVNSTDHPGVGNIGWNYDPNDGNGKEGHHSKLNQGPSLLYGSAYGNNRGRVNTPLVNGALGPTADLQYGTAAAVTNGDGVPTYTNGSVTYGLGGSSLVQDYTRNSPGLKATEKLAVDASALFAEALVPDRTIAQETPSGYARRGSGVPLRYPASVMYPYCTSTTATYVSNFEDYAGKGSATFTPPTPLVDPATGEQKVYYQHQQFRTGDSIGPFGSGYNWGTPVTSAAVRGETQFRNLAPRGLKPGGARQYGWGGAPRGNAGNQDGSKAASRLRDGVPQDSIGFFTAYGLDDWYGYQDIFKDVLPHDSRGYAFRDNRVDGGSFNVGRGKLSTKASTETGAYAAQPRYTNPALLSVFGSSYRSGWTTDDNWENHLRYVRRDFALAAMAKQFTEHVHMLDTNSIAERNYNREMIQPRDIILLYMAQYENYFLPYLIQNNKADFNISLPRDDNPNTPGLFQDILAKSSGPVQNSELPAITSVYYKKDPSHGWYPGDGPKR